MNTEGEIEEKDRGDHKNKTLEVFQRRNKGRAVGIFVPYQLPLGMCSAASKRSTNRQELHPVRGRVALNSKKPREHSGGATRG